MGAGEIAKDIIVGIGKGLVEIGKFAFSEGVKVKNRHAELRQLDDDELKKIAKYGSGIDKDMAKTILRKRDENQDA